ncbi:MAG: polysaccharide biosynthesis/export family protein [Gammaproteobacteria bacterium]|nr:polysaccharide biosynthesis/export family protein [Gammaproteobacteria bacterium]
MKKKLAYVTPIIRRGGSALALFCAMSGAALSDEARQYQVQPGDVLTVAVWKEKDMTMDVLVRPDGKFSFPLGGDLQAGGRATTEIQAELVKKIGAYIPDAVATVLVKEIAGNKAYVIGKVNRPGPFVMNNDTDVMQALSIAGGTATFAGLKDIVILRRQSGQLTAISFNYDQVQSGKNLQQNIVLLPGDVVVVP